MTDTSSLAARLRAIIRTDPSVGPSQPAPGPAMPMPAHAGHRAGAVDAILGGAWHERGTGRCLLIEQTFRADHRYGRFRIGEFADRLAHGAGGAALLAAGAPAPPFVFFDLETTGLSGGAGTCAFLVGLGAFAGDGSFVVRQLLLTRESDERAMLETFGDLVGAAGTLVSFNGRSFDAPMLDVRHAFHRLDWERTAGAWPHLDVLHPSRRFWSGRTDGACSLVALERVVLGAARAGDVAGFEIPDRYFRYLRSGDARPLASVLDHNRLDLLSLAGLTARLVHLAATGPGAAADAREAVALGHVYRRAGLDEAARDAFERAVSMDGDPTALADALRALALAERRARRYEEAARRWNAVLAVPGCPAQIAREASEALAVHHEHRARNLDAAREYALRGLGEGSRPAWTNAARYRLARLERKMGLRN